MDIQCLRVGIFSEPLRKYKIAWFYCCRECWFLLYMIYYVFLQGMFVVRGGKVARLLSACPQDCDGPGISTLLLLKEAAEGSSPTLLSPTRETLHPPVVVAQMLCAEEPDQNLSELKQPLLLGGRWDCQRCFVGLSFSLTSSLMQLMEGRRVHRPINIFAGTRKVAAQVLEQAASYGRRQHCFCHTQCKIALQTGLNFIFKFHLPPLIASQSFLCTFMTGTCLLLCHSDLHCHQTVIYFRCMELTACCGTNSNRFKYSLNNLLASKNVTNADVICLMPHNTEHGHDQVL